MLPLDQVRPHLLLPRHELPTVDTSLVPHVYGCDVRDEGLIRRMAGWLIGSCGASRIVAPTERFVLIAGELRTEFDLPGTKVETAVLFRDKALMKDEVRRAGVEVPPYVVVDGEGDLDDIDWSRGLYVMKDRYGSGSKNVHHVDTRDRAARLWRRTGWRPGGCEVEKHVAGLMYHCDSVVLDSSVVCSFVARYLSEQARFGSNRMNGSVLVRSGRLHDRIAQLNRRILAVLGLDSGVTHLELFHTSDDRLVFCEVAARPAGGWIHRMIEWAHDVNLIECSLRLDMGLHPFVRPVDRTATGAWACVGFYPPASQLNLSRLRNCSGVVDSEVHPSAGKSRGEPEHSSDYVARAVLTAPNDRVLAERILALSDRVIDESSECRDLDGEPAGPDGTDVRH